MDFNDIKRKAEAAREFQVTAKGMGFTLRLPTQHEVQLEVARARLHEGEEDPAQLLRVRRALVQRAIVEWRGVTCEHLAPGGGTDPAELSLAAAGLLLDADDEVSETLMAAFVEQRAARTARLESAAKN